MRLYTLVIPLIVVIFTLLSHIWVEGRPYSTNHGIIGAGSAIPTHAMNLQRRNPIPFPFFAKLGQVVIGFVSKKSKPSAKKDATKPPPNSPSTGKDAAKPPPNSSSTGKDAAKPPPNSSSTGKDAATPPPNRPSTGKDATNPSPNNPQSAPLSANGAHPPNNAVPGAAASAATSTPGKISTAEKINYVGAGAMVGMLPTMFMGATKDEKPEAESGAEAEAAGAEDIPATDSPPSDTSQDQPSSNSSQDPSPPSDSKLTQQGYTDPSQQQPSANQPAQPVDVKGTAYVDPSAPQYNANQGNPIMTSGTTVLA